MAIGCCCCLLRAAQEKLERRSIFSDSCDEDGNGNFLVVLSDSPGHSTAAAAAASATSSSLLFPFDGLGTESRLAEPLASATPALGRRIRVGGSEFLPSLAFNHPLPPRLESQSWPSLSVGSLSQSAGNSTVAAAAKIPQAAAALEASFRVGGAHSRVHLIHWAS